jgi:hypothetical protein
MNGTATFVIEDEFHAEDHGQFASFDEAVAELKRRAAIPWDQAPNLAPCMNWENCGRDYVIVEYDDSSLPWQELSRVSVMKVSASGTEWAGDFAGRG